MNNEIVQTILNSSGAAAVSFIAFFTFRKIVEIFTERIQKITDSFNKTISDHMERSAQLSIELNTQVKELNTSIKELKTANEAVFTQNYKLVKDMKCRDEIIKNYEGLKKGKGKSK